MSFSTLPLVVKVKIMKMLSIGCRYNLSFFWGELTGENFRSVPETVVGELISLLTSDGYFVIDSLDALEIAGVLASTGQLETLEKVMIKRIDLTNIPINIVNSLSKIVRGSLEFCRVTGLNFLMLANIKCERFALKKIEIPAQPTQDVRIRVGGSWGTITFEKISGNIIGLMKSISCDGSNSLKDLELVSFDISSVPSKIVNNSLKKIVSEAVVFSGVTGLRFSMLKNLECKKLWIEVLTIPEQRTRDISVNGKVALIGLDGNLNGLLDSISCDHLLIDAMTLDSDETIRLTEMLSRRVKHLEIGDCGDFEDCTILNNYDGRGRCEWIVFNREDEDDIVEIMKNFAPLANSMEGKEPMNDDEDEDSEFAHTELYDECWFYKIQRNITSKKQI